MTDSVPGPDSRGGRWFPIPICTSIIAVYSSRSPLHFIIRIKMSTRRPTPPPASKMGTKRVLVVGAGAAGMDGLSNHPDRFDVTLIGEFSSPFHPSSYSITRWRNSVELRLTCFGKMPRLTVVAKPSRSRSTRSATGASG